MFHAIAAKLTRYRWVKDADRNPDYANGPDLAEEREVYDGPLSGAELLSSQLVGKPGKHALVLDIDVPAALVPSSTEGHSHLYIDAEMDWWQYDNVMRALTDAHIIEPGYYMAAIRREGTYVRAPWNRKTGNLEESSEHTKVGMALLGEQLMLEDKGIDVSETDVPK